jgi:hypothetical protein
MSLLGVTSRIRTKHLSITSQQQYRYTSLAPCDDDDEDREENGKGVEREKEDEERKESSTQCRITCGHVAEQSSLRVHCRHMQLPCDRLGSTEE